MFRWIGKFIGGGLSTPILIAGVSAISFIGLLLYLLNSANKELAEVKIDLNSATIAAHSLSNAIGELKKNHEIELANAVLHKEIEVQIVYKDREVKREIIVYRDNPNVTKCNLDPNWVSIHEKAATGVTPRLPEDRITGTPSQDAGVSGNDTKLSVSDDIALEVVAINYNKYLELANNYVDLYKRCTGKSMEINF